jgi:hypothetical protein
MRRFCNYVLMGYGSFLIADLVLIWILDRIWTISTLPLYTINSFLEVLMGVAIWSAWPWSYFFDNYLRSLSSNLFNDVSFFPIILFCGLINFLILFAVSRLFKKIKPTVAR